jgi:transcriptional regulator with XRE-family HTH domain
MLDSRVQKCRQSLGKAIRAKRNKQGLSQSILASMINSGQSYIYRIEAGKTSPGLDRLVKIADALGVELRDLIDF